MKLQKESLLTITGCILILLCLLAPFKTPWLELAPGVIQRLVMGLGGIMLVTPSILGAGRRRLALPAVSATLELPLGGTQAAGSAAFPPAPVGNVPEAVLFSLAEAKIPSIPKMLEKFRRVSILGKSAVNLFNQHLGEFQRCLIDGADVRLLILDPESPIASSAYAVNPAAFRRNVETTKENILRLREELAQNATSGKLLTRALRSCPNFGMFIVELKEDNEWRVRKYAVVAPYFMTQKLGADRPALLLTENNPWYAAFEQQFEDLWKQKYSSEWLIETSNSSQS